jgi:GTPase Era involved in 16S rRNA processing
MVKTLPASGFDDTGAAVRTANQDAASQVPRIVLAGEANSGKTTLVNFLLQAQLLVADIVPNTPCPTLLRFGETAHLRVHRSDRSVALQSLADLHRVGREHVTFIEIFLPSAVLRRMEILDLPGFASPADAQAKARWVTAADIQIWCSLATQAWKASEQAMWSALAPHKRSSFLVLTHRDLLSQQQLGDVGDRITRETEGYFSRWTAIATPEAIAARNPRGQIVRQDVWASTGVEDFMKKLMDLLQSVVTQRRDPPAARPPSPAADLRHPLAAFASVRQRILQALGDEKSAERAATILASELEIYADEILRPWIASNRRPSPDTALLERLIPKKGVDIIDYLLPSSAGQPAIGPVTILIQIEAELTETFRPSL